MFSVCLSVDFVVWGEEGPYENQNCAKCELKIYGNEKTTYVRKITKLNHPPHSPDLASCEWNFFGFIPGTFYQISYCTQSTNPTTFANRNPRPSRRRELAASKLTQTHKNRDRPDKKNEAKNACGPLRPLYEVSNRYFHPDDLLFRPKPQSAMHVSAYWDDNGD